MNKSYFKEHIEHRLSPSSGMYNNSHNLFNLRGVEEGHVPLTRHFECNIEVGGQVVQSYSKGKNAKTPALLGSNLISLALNEFCETFGEECIRLFECPVGISPLWFSTLCLYYYAHIAKKAGIGASSVSSDPSYNKDKEGNNPNISKITDRKSQNTSNNQTRQGKGSQNQSKLKEFSEHNEKETKYTT